MARNALGRADREDLTFFQIADMFGDNEKACKHSIAGYVREIPTQMVLSHSGLA